jgi:hypothetical protein
VRLTPLNEKELSMFLGGDKFSAKQTPGCLNPHSSRFARYIRQPAPQDGTGFYLKDVSFPSSIFDQYADVLSAFFLHLN